VPAKPPTDDTGPHQRTAQRKPIVAFVWYRVVDDNADGDADVSEGIARSCDVSQGGVGIFTSRPLPTKARVFLEIATAVGNISAVGTITHCSQADDDYHRSGIHIEIVPPNDRALLARLLEA